VVAAIAAAGGIVATVTVAAAARSAATRAAAIQAAATEVAGTRVAAIKAAGTPDAAPAAKAAPLRLLQIAKCTQPQFLLQLQFSLPSGRRGLFFPTRPGHRSGPGRVAQILSSPDLIFTLVRLPSSAGLINPSGIL